MATKLFRVGIKTADTVSEHLVRANNLQQAKDHVTAGMIVGEVASQEDILRLAKGGTELKDATVPTTDPTTAPAAKTTRGRK